MLDENIFKLKNMVICISLVILCTIVFSLIGITGAKAIGSCNAEIYLFIVQKEKIKVSITFDCAWGADDIPKNIRYIGKKCQSYFFLVGLWAEKFPETVKLIAEKVRY